LLFKRTDFPLLLKFFHRISSGCGQQSRQTSISQPYQQAGIKRSN
jgi:hypothetical protein